MNIKNIREEFMEDSTLKTSSTINEGNEDTDDEDEDEDHNVNNDDKKD